MFADPYSVTSYLRRRRPRPRRVIVSVSDHWKLDAAGVWCREVVVDVDGRPRVVFLPDEHPALVRFLDRAAVAA